MSYRKIALITLIISALICFFGGCENSTQRHTQTVEQDPAKTKHNMGLMHTDGESVVQFPPHYIEQNIKLAEQGEPEAQYNLGMMYFGGLGVVQDYKEAMKWYRKAAEQGYAPAADMLGSLYVYGDNVEQS